MKRIAAAVLLTIVMSIPVFSHAECYQMKSSDDISDAFSSFKYDINIGILITMRHFDISDSNSIIDYTYQAVIPKMISGEVNQDFDRLFAIILKYHGESRITDFCFDGAIAPDAQLIVQSISVSRYSR